MDKNALTAELNEKFATQGIIFGIWERGDLPAAFIRNEYCTGIVTTYGAHVVSYIPEGGEEVLMMSRESKFAPNAIRGGVLICWPRFGSLRAPVTDWPGSSTGMESVRKGRTTVPTPSNSNSIREPPTSWRRNMW